MCCYVTFCFIILAERVYNFVARQRADHARIASELRFRFGHKSFYRFGIRSCLATSHKQILKTPFNMTSSCTLGFQATRPATWAHFIHPLLYVGESQSISEANNSGLQTQQCPIGQVAGNPCRRRFNTERTVTWTSARPAKKTTSPLIERPT